MENHKKELEEIRAELNSRIDAVIAKIEKPQFEVGKWYKSTIGKNTVVVNYQFIDKEDGSFRGYGLGYAGIWADNVRISKDAVLATPEEVQEALTKEAVKRGYNAINFECLNGGNLDLNENPKFFYLEFSNTLYYGHKNNANCVFDNGKWTEIIKPKTLEDLADEFEKFKYLPERRGLTIKQDFIDFLTKNKQQVIEVFNN